LTGENVAIGEENSSKDVAKKVVKENERKDIGEIYEGDIRNFQYDENKEEGKPNENKFQTVAELLKYID